MATKKVNLKFEWVDMGDRIYLKVNGKQPPLFYIVKERFSDGSYRGYLHSMLFVVPHTERERDTLSKVQKKAEALTTKIASFFLE